MCNDPSLIIDETIDQILFIIKDIDILMENEKDQMRLMEMLHLKAELIDSIKNPEAEKNHPFDLSANANHRAW